jgi:hypothetical protein
MIVLRLLPILLATLGSCFAQSVQRKALTPAACNSAPAKLQGGSVHLLRVEVLSSRPTDGTYSDDGFGQGEFDTVRLVEVIRSPIRWSPGLVFRVHPFQGKRSEAELLAPEHLTAGKRYLLVYTYHLDKVPHGDSDLIGLTRCGVHDDTPAAKRELLRSLGLSVRSR